MTLKKDASLGMSVGTVQLAKNLSLKGGEMPSLHFDDPVVVGAGYIPPLFIETLVIRQGRLHAVPTFRRPGCRRGGVYPRPSEIYPVFFGVKAQDVE